MAKTKLRRNSWQRPNVDQSERQKNRDLKLLKSKITIGPNPHP